ncbi:hypothetical protein KUTeg_009826 [Tegillarca granosa]|uniref:Uncharacterized protein n=1 Tax=Tegillarca granosa TaxID=220873 RepID=A0ABQ9F500_TEGGR|nr:hypothetical protein KUTeg_009826 [Tegillarca granosa]
MYCVWFIITLVFTSHCLTVSGDCKGKADIVYVVPGDLRIPAEEFLPFETFLTILTDYFVIDLQNVNIGTILYGREPIAIGYPQPFKDQMMTNARITLLSQREAYADQLSGTPDVAGALNLMRHMFRNPTGYPLQTSRHGSKKIGIFFTYGKVDEGKVQDVISTAQLAKNDGISIYIVGSGEKMLNSIILSIFTFLFTSEFWEPSPNPPVICHELDSIFQDPYNCAYYFKCDLSNIPRRERCPLNMLFDNKIKSCNYKDHVTCYSNVTCPQASGMFPHPRDCSKFLNCFQRIPYVQECPPRLVFNPKSEMCEKRTNVNCRVV